MPLSTYMQDELGSAVIRPDEPVEAGSHRCFDLVYTAGTFGIDDSGSIKIVWRFATDIGTPQFDDPEAPNYVSVEASNGALLSYHFDVKENIRPWGKTLYVKVVKGYLREGDRITVHYGAGGGPGGGGEPRGVGNITGGGPAMRMQTFCEDTLEFGVLVDAFATYDYAPLPESPTVRIVPGAPVAWRAVLPTLRRPGDPFRLGIQVEDRWGNPTDRTDRTITLAASLPVHGLPETVTVRQGEFGPLIENLVVDEEGDLVVEISEDSGKTLARSNPLRISARAATRHFWGDLHGQSEETIGTNSIGDYFRFARDRSFLDVSCHQGNDFQITREFWATLQQVTAELDEPGRFVTFPGYEWSGNTGMGGDHNVIFRREGEQIHRSSHALVYDLSDADTDRYTAAELFEALEGREVVVYAHVGGRYADLGFARDPAVQQAVQQAVEIHSAWGTFEWLLHDAFREGMKVGIVANSDGHKGRPGASYPGSSLFGSYGGLTCFLAEELSRDGIFDALRRRHHYATTGARMFLSVALAHAAPEAEAAGAEAAGAEASMGDEVRIDGPSATLRAELLAPSPIRRIDAFNGTELQATWRPYGPGDLGSRLGILWEGAEYRGRGRETTWDGTASLRDNSFADVRPVNFWNPERPLEQRNNRTVAWRSITTGGVAGLVAQLERGAGGSLEIRTPLVREDLRIADLGFEDTRFEAGGLNRALSVFRLPDVNETVSAAVSFDIPVARGRLNPLFLRIMLEDGHMAWSSPIYVEGA